MFQHEFGSPRLLRLADSAPVRVGGHRLVFEHPGDDGALVKIVREDRLPAKSRWKRWWLERSGFYHRDAPLVRELTEYLALRARSAAHPPFVPRIFGFAETDLGLGLVVAKMRGRDGGLAPSLDQLVSHGGATPTIRRHLSTFCETLHASRAIVSDLRLGNILLACDEADGERLVLVDGLGEKTLIPVNRFSRILNRQNCLRHLRRMMTQLEGLARRQDAPGSSAA
jgi:hypothetical protein